VTIEIKKADGLLYFVAIGLAAFVLVCTLRQAHAQPFYGDPYDGARAAQWRYPAPNVYRAPFAYAPIPPAVILPPPLPAEPPPYPVGWVYGPYTVCPNAPDCRTVFVSVGADGLNVRAVPNGPVLMSLANGTPVMPLQREGNWILVAPLCPLAPTYTWSITSGVPLSVCL
jgi:hypothetical protein